MSDGSNFSSYPTPPYGPGQIPSRSEISPRNVQNVQIIRLPIELQNNPPQQNVLDGRIIAHDKAQNRVTLRTAYGDIEIQIPQERPLPPRGTNVRIDLPPVREQSSPHTTQTPIQPRLQSTLLYIQTPHDKDGTQPASQNQTPPTAPRPESYQQPKTITPHAQASSLQEGQMVRLSLLPPSQLSQVRLPQALTTITTKLPPTLSFSSTQIPLPNLTQPTSAHLLQAVPLQIYTPLNILSSTTLQAFSASLSPTIHPSMIPAQTPTNILWLQQSAAAAPHHAPSANVTLQSHFQLPPNSAHAALSPDILNVTHNSPHSLTSNINIKGWLFPKLDIPILQIKPESIILTAPSSSGAALFKESFLSASVNIIQRPLATATHIPAQIIGVTPQGQNAVILHATKQVSPQFFILQNTSPLPVGTQLSFPASHLPLPPTTSSSFPLPQHLPTLFAPGTWPAIEEMIKATQQSNPAIAQNILRIIPSASQNPTQLGPAILFMLAAMKGGDLSTWLGDRPLDLLRRLGKGDLIQRLSGDVATLGRSNGEAISSDWRGMSIPLAWQDQIHRMSIFYKKDDHNNENENKTVRPTRFLFDLNLDRMGAVQLDGLFKPLGEKLRLDLVIRTETDCSAAMRQQMRLNYAHVLYHANLSGELGFQGHVADFIKVFTTEKSIGLST